jgi:SAM-dependent methyltransferase
MRREQRNDAHSSLPCTCLLPLALLSLPNYGPFVASSEHGALELEAGRRLFGRAPTSYEIGRPQYPDAVYTLLADRCGLGPGCAVLEVGPGTGIVTKRLLEAGASVVAVEPDPVLAEHLQSGVQGAMHVLVSSLEDAELSERIFDLVVAATAFHWVDQERGLGKIGRTIRTGGWVALWWLFGDPDRPSEFHRAAERIIGNTPVAAMNEPGRPPFQLDQEHRLRDMRRWAGLVELTADYFPFDVVMSPEQVRALYGSTAAVLRRSEAEQGVMLAAIETLARDQFGGRVERPFLTALYTGRRPG